MNRSLTPGTASLCPSEPRSSVELDVSQGLAPAALEAGAGEPPASQEDQAESDAPPGPRVTWERQAEERYVDSRELDQRYPVSGMTRWRWMNDPEVGFPKPVKLGPNGRNFWWLPAILEWERRRAARTRLIKERRVSR
jgi:predicted DNA-binding transcriptional regulator AlpA